MQFNNRGDFNKVPKEICEMIFRFCDEEGQFAVYSTCKQFRNLIDNRIFKAKLRSLHITLPNGELYFPYLARHYQTFSKYILKKFDLKKAEEKSILKIKESLKLETEKVNQTFLSLFQVIDKNRNETVAQEADKALQNLLEAGAAVPLRKTRFESVGRFAIKRLCDTLLSALFHNCSDRTIQFIIDSPNQPVLWRHVYNAINNNYSDMVINALLAQVSEKVEPLITEERCEPKSLIPLVFKKNHLSERTILRLLQKVGKFPLIDLQKIIGQGECENKVRPSERVLSKLFERVDVSTQKEAERLIKWFDFFPQAENCSLKPLSIFLDKIQREGISISERCSGDFISGYNHPKSQFYQQEEITYKLVCVSKSPFKLDTVKRALYTKHSDRVILELLNKTDKVVIASDFRILDTVLIDNPRPAIVQKLLEIGCKVNFNILRRALSGNRGLAKVKLVDYNIPPDETVLQVIDAYDGEDFRFNTVMSESLKYQRSDLIISKLIELTEALGEEEYMGIEGILSEMKRQNRPADLIQLLETKLKSGCILM